MKSPELLLPAKSDNLDLVLLLLLQTLLAVLFLDGGGKLYMDLLIMLSLLSGGGIGGMGDVNSELREELRNLLIKISTRSPIWSKNTVG